MEIQNSVIKKNLWLGAVFFIAGLAGYYWGLEYRLLGMDETVALSFSQFESSEPFELAARVKNSACVVSSGLPDHDCTPGAIFPEVTTNQICVKGYTKTVRNVSVSLKKRVYQAYNINYPPPYGSYELDHFIPLALGGNNDIANLFPQAAEPKPGFREKDLVENYLHEKVCAGDIVLVVAQRAINTNWISVYKSLSPSEIQRLKSEYINWSQTGD